MWAAVEGSSRSRRRSCSRRRYVRRPLPGECGNSMSRLREAFEKAARRHASSQPEKATAGKAPDSSQLPDDWDFDLQPSDAAHGAASTLVTFDAAEAVERVEDFESVDASRIV